MPLPNYFKLITSWGEKDYLGDYNKLFYQYRLISIAGHQEWTVLSIPYCKQQSV